VITFENSVFEEYWKWATEDKKIFSKINTLITEISRDPFHGTGKPEPLKKYIPFNLIIFVHHFRFFECFFLCQFP
jgi:Txe/YoeB family toxin of Txe-Axe toxin-antitoxin module